MTIPALLCILSLLLPAQPKPAQSTPGTTPLAEPYVDGSYGFSIRPPADWQLVRQRVPEKHGATLLRMVQSLGAGNTHQIVLKHTTTTRAVPMSDVLREVADKLSLEFSKIDIHAQQEQQIAGRPGGYLSATMTRSGKATLRFQAVVEIAPMDYFVLLYTGPAALRDKTEPLFARVMASLTLLGDRLEPDALDKALAAGAQWIAALQKKRLPKMPATTRYFRVDMDAKPIGLVKVTERPKRWKGHDGVRVSEEGWTFEQGGQVRRLQSRVFLSNDLLHERWRTSITLWRPAAKGKREQFENAFEEGLRDGEALLTSQTDSLNRPEKQNRPIKLPKTYVSRALIRLLPRLVGRLDQPRRYAFTTFDHQRTGLVFRVMELKGPAKLPTGAAEDADTPRHPATDAGATKPRPHDQAQARDQAHSQNRPQAQKVFRIDVREGLVAAPSTLYIDETGEILLMKAGKVTMRPAEAKSLEALFAARVSEADQAMQLQEKAYKQNESRFLRKPRPR